MNNIEIFKNEELGEVRTLIINGEPWFVGKDVAECLGYSNTRDALITHVDDEDKSGVAIYDGSQNRNMVAINESGMYALIFGSKLKSAKKFKHWVTHEVLPSIRKHGMYITNELLQDKEKLESEIESLKIENEMKSKRISDLEEIRKEYMIQNRTLSRLKIKNKSETSYLPNLTLQVIRDFLNEHKENIAFKDEESTVIKYKPLKKELKKLILRDNDILYVLLSLGARVDNNIVNIDNEMLKEDYVSECEIYI